MQKILTFILSAIIVFTTGLHVFADNLDFEKLDQVTLKYRLKDGSVLEAVQHNKHNGHFKQAVENMLDYYYNIYNVESLISLNDIPIEQTELSKYAGKIDDKKKGLGYSESPDIVARSKNNENMRLKLIDVAPPKNTRLKINDINVNFKGEIYTRDGVTFVPFRAVFEALGYDVKTDFNDYYRLIIATKKNGKAEERIEVKLDTCKAYTSIKGMVELEALPEITDSGTFIALSDISLLTGLQAVVKDNEVCITTE